MRLLGLGLIAVAVALIAASLLTRYLAYQRELASPGIAPPFWMRLFDVNSEANVPTWFNSGLLLLAGVAAVIVAWLHRPDRPRVAGFLTLFAVGLLALSVDELVSLHEQLGGLGSAIGGSTLHFAWVLPGAVVAVLGVVILARGLRALQSADRWPFIAGVTVLLTGGLVLEAISGIVLDSQGDRAAYLLVTAGEEFLEMAGAALLLLAVLRLVTVERDGAIVQLTPLG